MIRIQMKVYDETGKRHHVTEIEMPCSVTDAVDHVEKACERLKETFPETVSMVARDFVAASKCQAIGIGVAAEYVERFERALAWEQ